MWATFYVHDKKKNSVFFVKSTNCILNDRFYGNPLISEETTDELILGSSTSSEKITVI